MDGRGVPLSLVVSGANRHDRKLLCPTLENVVKEKPEGMKVNLCADAGYKGEKVAEEIAKHGYIARVQSRFEEKKAIEEEKHPARRWVVERANSWFNRFRKLLVSFEKTESSYLALQMLAAALICWRQTLPING